MTKSQIFTAAHQLAKTFEGDYSACFALALREVRQSNTQQSLTLRAVGHTSESSIEVSFEDVARYVADQWGRFKVKPSLIEAVKADAAHIEGNVVIRFDRGQSKISPLQGAAEFSDRYEFCF